VVLRWAIQSKLCALRLPDKTHPRPNAASGRPAPGQAPGRRTLRCYSARNSDRERSVGSVLNLQAAYLAGDPAVVGAALPETPAVVCDVPDNLVLIGKVHLPDQGPVAKHPHLSHCSARAARTPPIQPRRRDCGLRDASNRLLGAQAR
jgi:hypothetical protein